ncbi:MAG: hypothetical protein HC915_02530 [Anaerolineae bacterium]|nr:hypothetical protein [Anaerolineae bacterium]
MDILRRLFGLQPAPAPTLTPPPAPAKGEALEGPTAPLENKQALPAEEVKEDLGKTNILDDGNTRRLPDFDAALGDGKRTSKQLVFGMTSDVGQVRNNNQDAVLSFISPV